MASKATGKQITIALVGEFSPPFAGMAVQAELLVKRLPELGISVARVVTNYHFTGALSFLNNVKYVRGVLRLTVFLFQCSRIVRSEVVHVFSSSGLNYYLFTAIPVLISRCLGKHVIVNYHGGNAEAFFRHRRRLLQWSLKRNASLVVPSGFLTDVFSRYGYASVIIPNVINTERFVFRERDHFPPNVVVCRNFTNVYNVACAVRAFGHLQSAYPKATLSLAGDGPERENLKRLVQSLELRNVRFLGNVSNERMNEVYAGADIFLNTSNVDNLPNSVLEAFACGLPVVSTDPGGIPYMVDHGVSGFLAPVNDDRALGEYLVRVVEHPDEARAMVRAGRDRLTLYTWENAGPLWVQHYQAYTGQTRP